MSRFIWLRTGDFFFFFLSCLFTFVRNFYDFLFFSFFPFYLFFIGFFFATCSSFVGSSVTSHTHTQVAILTESKKKRKIPQIVSAPNFFGDAMFDIPEVMPERVSTGIAQLFDAICRVSLVFSFIRMGKNDAVEGRMKESLCWGLPVEVVSY